MTTRVLSPLPESKRRSTILIGNFSIAHPTLQILHLAIISAHQISPVPGQSTFLFSVPVLRIKYLANTFLPRHGRLLKFRHFNFYQPSQLNFHKNLSASIICSVVFTNFIVTSNYLQCEFFLNKSKSFSELQSME